MKEVRNIIIDSFNPGSAGFISLTLMQESEIGPSDQVFMFSDHYCGYKAGLTALGNFTFPDQNFCPDRKA